MENDFDDQLIVGTTVGGSRNTCGTIGTGFTSWFTDIGKYAEFLDRKYAPEHASSKEVWKTILRTIEFNNVLDHQEQSFKIDFNDTVETIYITINGEIAKRPTMKIYKPEGDPQLSLDIMDSSGTTSLCERKCTYSDNNNYSKTCPEFQGSVQSCRITRPFKEELNVRINLKGVKCANSNDGAIGDCIDSMQTQLKDEDTFVYLRIGTTTLN